MKLHIVHDAAGRILAAAEIKGKGEGPRPMPGRGQREIVLDVPRELRAKGLLEICETLRVDAKAGTLVAPRERAVAAKLARKRT